MKPASPALIAYLAANNAFIMADLWTFTFKNGVIKRWTSYDRNLVYAGNTFACNSILIDGGNYRLVRGLEVDEMDVTLIPIAGSTENINGIGIIEGIQQGIFDRATVKRERIFMPTVGDTSLGALIIFLGEITDSETTRFKSTLKIKSILNLLNTPLPRRQYQGTCPYTFGDTSCGVNKATYTASSSILAGSTAADIRCALTQGFNYFTLGVLKFTSGKNAGLSRTVKKWATGNAILSAPFPSIPEVGDTFMIVAGCSKALSADNTVPFQPTSGAVINNPTTITNIYCDFVQPTAAPISVSGLTKPYIVFTSGINNGVRVKISAIATGLMTLAAPLATAPSTGDKFYIDGTYITGIKVVAQGLNALNTNLVYPSGYFSGGYLRFTSGALVGGAFLISAWDANGYAKLAQNMPSYPATGDTFTIVTPSQSAVAGNTCTSYSNTARFGGFPYVPVPETAF
jgi:uncharacterized phage protein (TIGR02218 family)